MVYTRHSKAQVSGSSPKPLKAYYSQSVNYCCPVAGRIVFRENIKRSIGTVIRSGGVSLSLRPEVGRGCFTRSSKYRNKRTREQRDRQTPDTASQSRSFANLHRASCTLTNGHTWLQQRAKATGANRNSTHAKTVSPLGVS